MRFSIFWTSLASVMFFLTYLADASVNHGVYLWLFSILTYVLLRSIQFGRMFWFYTFMVVMFFLGCWLKVVIHHIFDYPFIEPTGRFDNSENLWQSYYGFAYIFEVAFIISKLFLTYFDGRVSSQYKWQFMGRPVKTRDWLKLIAFAGVFYTVNNIAGFNVTGVHPNVILPFSLNAPVAFMALIGFAVVVSVYLAKDVALKQRLDSVSTMAVITIAGFASVSMASRAAIFMQAFPMLVASTYVIAVSGVRAVSIRPFVQFGVLSIFVLVIVAIYRINVYSGGSIGDTELLMFSAMENVMLIIDRWVGTEQILVGISEPTHSAGLFFQLLIENPTSGVNSIYQTLAGTKYEVLEKLTFLTLPGYFGVLSLSGSAVIVFLGTVFMVTAGMMYEKVFLRRALFGQVICVALVSAGIANSLTQLSFPVLVLPFIFQMTVLVLVLHYFFRSQFSRMR